MSYFRDIETFELIVEFNTPLASSPSNCTNTPVGSLILIMDSDVWVRDIQENKPNQFSKAVYSPEFVRMNPKIFRKVDI